jgi:hypothetical protein
MDEQEFESFTLQEEYQYSANYTANYMAFHATNKQTEPHQTGEFRLVFHSQCGGVLFSKN